MQTDGNKQAGRAGKIKPRGADVLLLSERALLNGTERRRETTPLPPPLLAGLQHEQLCDDDVWISSQFGPWLIIPAAVATRRLVEAVNKVVWRLSESSG